MTWTKSDMPDLTGRSFVVTGGNSGIGFATARVLAGSGAHVIIGCRNAEKGRKAVAAIAAEHPAAQPEALPLDLANFGSVHAFADRVAKRDGLDGLINNGGIMMVPHGKSVDGFELHFATNVLGHHLLTGRLLPLLEAGGNGRIVTVSSLGHWFGKLELDNLNAERSYHPTRTYAQSKLANLVLAFEMHRRLQRENMRIASIGAHPGVCYSNLGRHAGWANMAMRLYGQSIDDGALPLLMAAVEPEVASGDYIGPSGFLTFKGSASKQRSRKWASDLELGRALWERACEMTGISYL